MINAFTPNIYITQNKYVNCPRDFCDKDEVVSENLEWRIRQRSHGSACDEQDEQVAENCFYPTNSTPNFRGINRTVLVTQKSTHKCEIVGRKLLNKISGLFNRRFVNQVDAVFTQIDRKTPEYIYAVSGMGRVFAQNMEVEINSEAKIIEKLARDKKAHIFIMNHDNQSRDPKMLGFFNTLLNEEYVLSGNAATCPRSRIILNEDILNTMNPKMRNIFESLGAIGIDACLNGGNKVANGKKMAQLMREYINGESNIYIFPEGKNCALKHLPLRERFQPGIANIIEKLAAKTDVSVVPLAFAYGKSKNLASMQIGEPILFNRNSANKKEAILDIICDALEKSVSKAKDNLPQKSLGEQVIYV